MLAAVRAGIDPQLAAAETRKIQTELADTAATIEAWERSEESAVRLTEDHGRQAVGGAGDLVGLLAAADRADRADLHRALGVQLRLHKRGCNRA